MTTIPSELTAAAQLAGMIDPADLDLLDLTGLPRDAAGRIRDPRAAVEQIRQDKPALFNTPKRARDMSPAERAAALREARREPKPEPCTLPHTGKRASEMTSKEQAEFIEAFKKIFPAHSQGMSAPRKSRFK